MANFDVDDLFAGLDATMGMPLKVDTTPVQTKSSSNLTIKQTKDLQSALVKTGLSKMAAIEMEMNSYILERKDQIRCMLLAVIGRQSLLMLGPAGCGKSLIATEFCSRIEGGKYFQWMLNKTSDPSELLGPISIKGMENDRFFRVTTNKLPEAHIAFLDEVYKCNSTVLNILLPVMNEKIFYNDGIPCDIPLLTVIGASNEAPEDDSLLPFHDRFIFRFQVDYISDSTNKVSMVNNYIARRNNKEINTRTGITIDEIKALGEKAKEIAVSKAVVDNLVKIINSLRRQGCIISDRRMNECIKVIQANALLRGASTCSTVDFAPLVNVLWTNPEQIPLVQAEIGKLKNKVEDDCAKYQATLDDIKRIINSETDIDEKTQRVLENSPKIAALLKGIDKTITVGRRDGNDVELAINLKLEVSEFQKKLSEASMTGNYSII